jgi:hypothetical protein
MRVALAEEPGGTGSVELSERPAPAPAAGQALVKVRGAGVGPWDAGYLGGGWSRVSRFSPQRLHRPSCLDSGRTVQESSGGFTLWRRCARYRPGRGHRVMPRLLTRVCRAMSVQAGFGR